MKMCMYPYKQIVYHTGRVFGGRPSGPGIWKKMKIVGLVNIDQVVVDFVEEHKARLLPTLG